MTERLGYVFKKKKKKNGGLRVYLFHNLGSDSMLCDSPLNIIDVRDHLYQDTSE